MATNREFREKHQEKIPNETLVISRTDEGFRVYSPINPLNSYIVSGSPQAPLCTCPDFQHAGNVNWRCKHIQAVLDQLNGSRPQNGRADSYEEEERLAIQDENLPPSEKPAAGNDMPQMLLKRSVSPDGRIDSLSIEFACSLKNSTEEEIKSRAAKAMRLQSDLVAGFLGKGAGKSDQKLMSDGSVPAKMIGIAGMNTRFGRRLFINIEAGGNTFKLFGSPKQLAEAVIAAGYPQLARNLGENLQLNVPCRITTKKSDDGRYVNVDRVFPANGNGERR